MKKLLLGLSLVFACIVCFGQSTNTNFVYSTNLTWIITRTNIPFQLSQSPTNSGISNIISAGPILGSSFRPKTNLWVGPTNYLDASTNSSYFYAALGNVAVTGYAFAGAFATNEPIIRQAISNASGGLITNFISLPYRCINGSRLFIITNGDVEIFTYRLGYGMTNISTEYFW